MKSQTNGPNRVNLQSGVPEPGTWFCVEHITRRSGRFACADSDEYLG